MPLPNPINCQYIEYEWNFSFTIAFLLFVSLLDYLPLIIKQHYSPLSLSNNGFMIKQNRTRDNSRLYHESV